METKASTVLTKIKERRKSDVVGTVILLSSFALSVSLIAAAIIGGLLGWIFGVGVFIILEPLILNSVVNVEATYFAIPTRFGRRLKRVLYEGPNFKLPLIDQVKPEYAYSLKPQTLPIRFVLVTNPKERVKLSVRGLIRYQPDPVILNKDTGLCRFVEIEPDTLKKGLNSKLQSELGRLGGIYGWENFIENRRALENYLNCILRLSVPPHVNPKKVLCSPEMENVIWKENSSEMYKALHKELQEMDWEVEVEKRLEFYSRFSGPIGDLLRQEEHLPNRSADEMFYGINLLEFTFEEISFTEETQKAFEREAQAASLQKKKIEMLEELTAKGIKPQAALDSAELNLSQAEKKIFSVHGLGGLIDILKEKGGK